MFVLNASSLPPRLSHLTARLLVKFYDRLFVPSSIPASGARVLVPLCGKSLDLAFLHSQGHQVIGIEAVPDAISVFSQESGIPMVRQQTPGGRSEVHASPDGRLVILVTDFLKVEQSDLPCNGGDASVTHGWDRAALYALDADLRPRYAAAVKRLFKLPAFRYLLTTLEYDGSAAGVCGPPHAVFESEVEALFGDVARIERLEETEVSFALPKFQEKGVCVKEVVYLLTAKTDDSQPA